MTKARALLWSASLVAAACPGAGRLWRRQGAAGQRDLSRAFRIGRNAGPVRDQPSDVLGEKRSSRVTPPRAAGGVPNAAAALGCLGRPFADTRARPMCEAPC